MQMPPPPSPRNPAAGHLEVVWRHGGVSPAQTDRNMGATSLPRLRYAQQIFNHFPVGHPPRRDVGR